MCKQSIPELSACSTASIAAVLVGQRMSTLVEQEDLALQQVLDENRYHLAARGVPKVSAKMRGSFRLRATFLANSVCGCYAGTIWSEQVAQRMHRLGLVHSCNPARAQTK